jgi:hypothetical protein
MELLSGVHVSDAHAPAIRVRCVFRAELLPKAHDEYSIDLDAQGGYSPFIRAIIQDRANARLRTGSNPVVDPIERRSWITKPSRQARGSLRGSPTADIALMLDRREVGVPAWCATKPQPR